MNTYWYAVLKKGKVFERYIGKHNDGVWEDTSTGFHLRYVYIGNDVELP